MFTGLVQCIGEVAALGAAASGARVRISADLDGLELGESVSVSGVCLTVSRVRPDGFEADASPETLAVTTLGGWRQGTPVNLERACRLTDRLGGHLVLGHVDAVAEVMACEQAGESRRLAFSSPPSVARYLAPKGSVALDGVSLTVNLLPSADRFEVMVVPHSLRVTTLAGRRPGDRVNLEADVMARYAARLLEHGGLLRRPATDGTGREDHRLMGLLRAGGFAD